jgi:pilus assembly protein CpaF
MEPMTLQTMLAFFQPARLREVILSPDYSDVMINPDGSVFADQGGLLKKLDVKAGSVLVAIQNLARAIGKDFTPDRPIVDTRLPDGSRVAALLNQDGSAAVTIRKFARWFTSDELIERSALTAEVREILVDGICGADGDAANIVFSGGTSSGKSTQVKALIDHIQPEHRLISIEKPIELQIAHENVLRWEADDAAPGQMPTRSVAQLVVAALRHRPDHIIIGEVREPETAYQMLQAMNTGHSGTLSTIHADSAEQALDRIADLALAAHSNLSPQFMRRQVLQAISLVCHVSRQADGSRGVRELIKVSPEDGVAYLYRRKK